MTILCVKCCIWRRNKFYIINKASNFDKICFADFIMALKCNFFAVVFSSMSLNYLLQNRVPRVQILLPLPKDQTPVFLCLVFFIGLISFGVCQICEALMVLSECLSCSEAPIDLADHLKFFCSCVSDGDFMVILW